MEGATDLVKGTSSDGYENITVFTFILFAMAIFLHQSNVIFNMNISFADIFCLFIFLILFMNKQLYFSKTSLIFFMLISVVVLMAAVFFVPFHFQIFSTPKRIISDFSKLCVVFLYFLIGYNLVILNRVGETLKWYSYSGLFVGLLGLFVTILNVNILTDLLFYAGVRYKGFMNDPNYFAILQITALVYFTRISTIQTKVKLIAYVIFFFSVILSGSKTGIITLFCYFTYRIVEYSFLMKKKIKSIMFIFIILLTVILGVVFTYGILQDLMKHLEDQIPTFSRVQSLIIDFDGAVSQDGSEREMAWIGGMQMIQHSPLIGVGVGTYMSIGDKLFQYSEIAHNTFLQVAAEWGIPLAVLLFTIIFLIIGKSFTTSRLNGELTIVLRDILIILLIGSLAISLNNSRIFWLVLGALVSLFINGKKKLDYQCI